MMALQTPAGHCASHTANSVYDEHTRNREEFTKMCYKICAICSVESIFFRFGTYPLPNLVFVSNVRVFISYITCYTVVTNCLCFLHDFFFGSCASKVNDISFSDFIFVRMP